MGKIIRDGLIMACNTPQSSVGEAGSNPGTPISKEGISKKEHALELSLKKAIADQDVGVRSSLGQLFERTQTEIQKLSYKRLSTADKAQFRLDWASKKLKEMELSLIHI